MDQDSYVLRELCGKIPELVNTQTWETEFRKKVRRLSRGWTVRKSSKTGKVLDGWGQARLTMINFILIK